tara:strand:- start:33643 stop:34071 length:429 start_codon:yes stop_codon:yes gene_type:complete
MIQRIQSIYLLLVLVLSIGFTFFFKIWEVAEKKVYAFDLFSYKTFLAKLVPIFFIISAFVALVAIFQYNKRQLQFVLGRVIILINLFLLGILIYLSLNIPGEVSSEKGIGMFIPSVVILFAVMANKSIRKDENLVKSVDRLR